jgi:hypothetical protein
VTGLGTASAAVRAPRQPVVLYASPHGTAASCAVSAPCGLSGAQRRVEQLSAHMTADIDVDLSGGTYRVPGGFRLGPADRQHARHAAEFHAQRAGLVLRRNGGRGDFMAYRNGPGNVQEHHPVHLYEQSVALDSAAKVIGVILPSVGSGPARHAFGLAIG